MGLPAVRLGDVCSGHSCWPPRPNTQGSPNVYVNKLPWHRVGDAWATHCCGLSCHDSVLATGSPTVRVNGIPAGRITSRVACGSVAVTGSPDTRCE